MSGMQECGRGLVGTHKLRFSNANTQSAGTLHLKCLSISERCSRNERNIMHACGLREQECEVYAYGGGRMEPEARFSVNTLKHN